MPVDPKDLKVGELYLIDSDATNRNEEILCVLVDVGTDVHVHYSKEIATCEVHLRELSNNDVWKASSIELTALKKCL